MSIEAERSERRPSIPTQTEVRLNMVVAEEHDEPEMHRASLVLTLNQTDYLLLTGTNKDPEVAAEQVAAKWASQMRQAGVNR